MYRCNSLKYGWEGDRLITIAAKQHANAEKRRCRRCRRRRIYISSKTWYSLRGLRPTVYSALEKRLRASLTLDTKLCSSLTAKGWSMRAVAGSGCTRLSSSSSSLPLQSSGSFGASFCKRQAWTTHARARTHEHGRRCLFLLLLLLVVPRVSSTGGRSTLSFHLQWCIWL